MLRHLALASIVCTIGFSAAPGFTAGSEWPTGSPQDGGFPIDIGDRIDAVLAEDGIGNVHSILLIRDGKLIFERYRSGSDEKLGYRIEDVIFDASMKHDIRSITKSVVGLLYGIALADGAVPDLDRPLVDSFPEYPDLSSDTDRRKITIGNTLTMSLGLAWNELGPGPSSEPLLEEASDKYRFVLAQPIASAPGTDWTYNGGGTTLLAKIIARGTGMSIAEFAQAELFDPLGIKDVEWMTDYYGVPWAHAGLRLRPRDLAKLGQLVLDGGRWNGAHVVPHDWIEAMIRPALATDDPGCDYGYQVWLCQTAEGVDVVELAGLGGQGVLIVPSQDLVLTSTGGEYRDNPEHWKARWRILEDVVLPSLN